MEINKAVQEYLDGADKNWTWEAEVKNWDKITVDYIWRLSDWTVFDTSVESVAKACWKYNEARNYEEWLTFEVWAWQMIKWFDEWVMWMKEWQTKTVEFWPEKWYWEYSDEYIVSYTKDEIQDFSMYTTWDYFQPNPYVAGVVTNITDKEMVVDFNHELAWKSLIFDITIKNNYWSEK